MELQKIKEQMEFYFSDANFSKDKFMQARAKENDGFIPISIFLTFKRMQSLKADASKIKKALKDSKIVLIKDETLKKVETLEYENYCNIPDLSDRIIYIKGFPDSMNLDDVQSILKNYFSPVKVTLRRDKLKKFTGNCFVECSSAEEAKKVLNMKIPVEIIKETEEAKKSKNTIFLEIISKNDFLKDYKKDEKDSFAEKVKESFIPRLYKYDCDVLLSIEELKSFVKDAAFADVIKKVIRLKYLDERESFDIEFEKDGKNHLIKLTKFSEDEAKEYVKNLTIKKNSNKKSKK